VLNGTLDPEGGAIMRTARAAVEGKPVAGGDRTAAAPPRRHGRPRPPPAGFRRPATASSMRVVGG
jgi:hypothetical protein